MSDPLYPDLRNNSWLRLSQAYRRQIFPLIYKLRGADLFGRMLKSLSPPARGPLIMKTNSGFALLVDPITDKGLESALYEKGTYEAGTLHLLSHILEEGDTFIDVGANIGLMSFYASKKVGLSGQVYAFEPQASTFDILAYNIKLNQSSNITAFNHGFGAQEAQLPIFDNLAVNRGSASLLSDRSSGFSHMVQVKTLDSFLADAHIKVVKALKIDVEGWELEVLKGGLRMFDSARRPIVIIEYSNLHPIEGGRSVDIYHFLKQKDYKIFKLKGSKERISPLKPIINETDLPDHDNLVAIQPNQVDKLSSKLFI